MTSNTNGEWHDRNPAKITIKSVSSTSFRVDNVEIYSRTRILSDAQIAEEILKARRNKQIKPDIADFQTTRSADIKKDDDLCPPLSGEVLIRLVCPKSMRDALVGDCQEVYRRNLVHGKRRAKVLYWAELVASLRPLMFARLKRWGVFALVVDALRRVVGG